MLKKLGVIVICCLLSACTLLSGDKNDDRLARCKEIKHRIIFNGTPGNQLIINGSTGNQIGEAQRPAEVDKLEQDYRRLGCS